MQIWTFVPIGFETKDNIIFSATAAILTADFFQASVKTDNSAYDGSMGLKQCFNCNCFILGPPFIAENFLSWRLQVAYVWVHS
jgi:hypothetical protein